MVIALKQKYRACLDVAFERLLTVLQQNARRVRYSQGYSFDEKPDARLSSRPFEMAHVCSAEEMVRRIEMIVRSFIVS